MTKVNLSNARHPDQIKRMLELKRTGQCHFCRKGFEGRHDAPIIYEKKNWFIAANNYPYKGTKHHYLIVPKTHVTKASQLSPKARVELFDAIAWLEKKFKVKGASIFVRSGDMAYTGATLNHLHFHFIVGKKKPDKKPNHDRDDLILVVAGFQKK